MSAIIAAASSIALAVGGGLLLAALAILGFRWLFGGWENGQ